MVCSTASNSNDVRIPTVPSPTVSRTKEAPGLTAYREEGHPIPRLLTLGAQNHLDQALHPIMIISNDIHPNQNPPVPLGQGQPRPPVRTFPPCRLHQGSGQEAQQQLPDSHFRALSRNFVLSQLSSHLHPIRSAT